MYFVLITWLCSLQPSFPAQKLLISACRQDCADGPNLQALESSPHSITFVFLSAWISMIGTHAWGQSTEQYLKIRLGLAFLAIQQKCPSYDQKSLPTNLLCSSFIRCNATAHHARHLHPLMPYQLSCLVITQGEKGFHNDDILTLAAKRNYCVTDWRCQMSESEPAFCESCELDWFRLRFYRGCVFYRADLFMLS
jgi:hypothetical protein